MTSFNKAILMLPSLTLLIIVTIQIAMVREINSYVGIYCIGSFEDCSNYLQHSQTFPLTISLENEGGKTISYVLKSPDDLPKHDVPTQCPNGITIIKNCWFVKYDRDRS